MHSKDQFTKIEIEPGGFARGYVRGCTDTLKRIHELVAEKLREIQAGDPDPAPVAPSFIIVIRRAGGPLLLAAIALSLFGCTGPRPQRGGKAVTAATPAGRVQQLLLQGENPSAPSRQTQETIRTRTYTFPEPATFNFQPATAGQPAPVRQPATFNFQPATSEWSRSPWSRSPLQVTEREESRATTELGAAQKDTAREFTAKLSSLKGITWVGVALFIFGIASFAWPPLRTIIGSVTTSAAITLGGVALMILPTLIVGNELLILGAVTAAVGGWFLAHRHGHLRGQITPATPSRPKPLSMATGK